MSEAIDFCHHYADASLQLTDEAMAQFVALFSGPMYAGMVVLTVATSLVGALVSLRVMRKHFEKAGIV